MPAARKIRGSLSVLVSSALVFGALVVGAPAAYAEEAAPADQVAASQEVAPQAEAPASGPSAEPDAPASEQPAVETPAEQQPAVQEPDVEEQFEEPATQRSQVPATAQALNVSTPTAEDAPPRVWEPAISVAFADGTPVSEGTKVYEGDQLVVSGSGFDPESHPAGRRPPLTAGDPSGNYVVFGNFGESWKPSSGAATTQRVVGSQKWAMTDATYGNINPNYVGDVTPDRVTLGTDGSFEATLTVKKTDTTPGSYGVFTYVAGGGAADASQELELRLDYQGERPRVWEPAISVAFADGTPVSEGTKVYEGDQLVVSGSGFDPESHPAGRRPPLTAGDPSGNYVVFGNFGESWKPSSGAATTQRVVGSQKWAMTDATYGNINPNYVGDVTPDRVTLGTDGSFEATLTVKKTDTTPGSYGVFTYVAGGGAADASQELELRLDYQGERPAVEAVVDGFSTGETGLSVEVSGIGFSTTVAPAGVYVAVVEAGAEIVTGYEATIAAVANLPASAIVGGEFSKSLLAAPEKLDREKSYEVLVWKAHGAATAETTYLRAPLALTSDHWDRIFGPSTHRAYVEPTVTAASEAGLQVSADISRIKLQEGDAGVYVAIIEDGAEAEVTQANMGVAAEYFAKSRIVDGAVSSSLAAAAEKLDREKKYEVLVWRAHGLASEDRILGRGAIEVTDEQWDDVFGGPAGPEGDAVVTAATAAGLGFSANLRGFDPAAYPNGVYVGLIEAGTAEQASSSSVLGTEWVNPIPAEGSISQAVTVVAASLDRTKSYEVLVWRAHSNPSAANNVLVLPLEVSEANWDGVFGASAPTPAGEARVASASAAGLEIMSELSGFDPAAYPNGVYVGLIEAGSAEQATSASILGTVHVSDVGEDGQVSQAITAPAASLDRTKSYEVLVWKGHTNPSAANNVLVLPLEVSTANWDLVFPVELANGSFEWGVREQFRSYVTGPIAHGKILVQAPATGSSVYRFPQVKGGTWSAETGLGTVEFAGLVNFAGHGGSLNLNLANPVIDVTSDKRALLKAPYGAKNELLTIATLDLAGATKSALDGGAVRYENVRVSLTEAGANDFFENYLEESADMDTASFTLGAATNETPVDPPQKLEKPKPAPTPVPAPAPVSNTAGQQAGSLTWGVSSGFAEYTTGRIAKGTVSTSGVGGGPGGYLFPQSSSSWNQATQTGSVQYSGVVTFTGHHGAMSESFANPVITVTSASSGSLSAGGRTFGLNLAAGSKSVGANGEVTWSGVPVSGIISGSGAGGGGSFGADPVTFTVGSASGASFGSSSVSADDKKRTAAATPPATTGIRVLTPAEEIVPGGEIEFEASGFERNERDVLVVVYSDPVVLDDAAGADANGVVRWIGNLPEDLPLGEHTITLQGSADAGAIIDVVNGEKKAKKAALTKAEGELAEVAPAQAAVLGIDEDSPVWMWWVGAAGLLVLAGAMTALLLAQRLRAGQS